MTEKLKQQISRIVEEAWAKYQPVEAKKHVVLSLDEAQKQIAKDGFGDKYVVIKGGL